jgi:hypothetical protein
MKNEKLAEFLHRNRLKSTDLVEFWGVTKGVVSQILNGTTKLPTKRLEELLNNPHGWDTSMLTEDEPAEALPSQEDSLIAELRAQIERLESKVDSLNQELGEKNALLKLLRQGEIESV